MQARLITITTLMTGVLAAGCGGGSSVGASSTPGAATMGSASSKTSGATTDSRPGGLAFARCMRSSGVPNFPDPSPGRGLVFAVPPGASPNSPALKAAQAKCQKLLPGGGPPGPGSVTHPSDQTVAKLLRVAACMHQHGVSDFPDPRSSVPDPLNSGIGVITDYDGAILLFPSTLNMQSPAYKQAAAACGALAEKIGRPH